MVILLDPSECFKDSPQFRHDLEIIEESTDKFVEALKKVIQVGKKCVDNERGNCLNFNCLNETKNQNKNQKASIQSFNQLTDELTNLVSIDGNQVFESEASISNIIFEIKINIKEDKYFKIK